MVSCYLPLFRSPGDPDCSPCGRVGPGSGATGPVAPCRLTTRRMDRLPHPRPDDPSARVL